MFKFCSASPLVIELCIGIIAAVSAVISGICRCYPVFLIPQLQEDDNIILTEQDISWLGSLTMLSMPVGCLIGGAIMELLGRKLYFAATAVPTIIGWILTLLPSTNLYFLYLTCALNGVTAGMGVCISTYIGEVCSPKRRAMLASLSEPFFCLGLAICNIVLYNMGWKKSAQFFIIFTIISLLCQLLLPESPNWLIRKGKIEQAKEILLLRSTELEVANEIFQLQEHYRKLDKNDKSNFIENLNGLLECWKQILILLALNFLQQACGFNVLVSYTVIFFQNLNVPFDDDVAAIIYSLVGFVATFFIPFTIFYLSRKNCLILSGLGAGISLSLVGIYEFYYLNSLSKPMYGIVLISMFVYHFFISIGIITIGYVLSSEIFPSDVAGFANGLYGCFSYISAGIILKIFHPFLMKFGIIVTICIFCIFSLLHVPYAVFVIPETRGKSIIEIQEQYFPRKLKNKNPGNIHL